MPSPSRSLWFTDALLPDGWAQKVRLHLRDGAMTAIERDVAPASGEERHGPVVPGLPNLHSHAFQRGLAGLAEMRGPGEDSFWGWREVMYRFVDRVGPEDVEALAALAYMEMLESGFTRVGEFHYLHHDPAGAAYADRAELATRISAAAAETGIALTLLPVFYAHSGFGGLEPGHGQRRFINDLDGFAALMAASRAAVAPLEDAVVGIAPHSLRAASLEEITAILPLAAGGPVHIHVAEQTKEVEDCLAWCGQRPVEHLFGGAPVDTRWCLIHATHMTEGETRQLAQSQAVAGLCPITEANLGDGIFPAAEFARAGGRYGIGSDSNVLVDAAEELRTLEYGQRLRLRARNVLAGEMRAGEALRSTGRALFDAALAGGGQALQVPCGAAGWGIAVGAPADLVTLDPGRSALAARAGDAWLDGWIFGARGGAVDGVWRRGRKYVTNGLHHDHERIRGRFARVMERVLA
ncbi:formimidoylglutamate deiminase [Roseixanthobacter glucoisosaccharinicivorans]|uniref:formimidoylglutamate deiminase n=1 Tax=Roseixanthobacter glucoisosaccharinicivorans TaxID=3119923 RepID=UPI003726483F